MTYAILRTVKITDVNKTIGHNIRTNFIGSNVDKNRSHKNKILIDELGFSNNKLKSSEEILIDYYEKKGVKLRKNSVKAMEFLLTASPEFFENSTVETQRIWVENQIEFAKKEWGKNLKFAVLHVDETTPHIHLVVSTEETKIHTYKNKHGSFQKEKTSLNASKFDPDYLRKLQTKFAKANEKFNLKRGVVGSKATHKELKVFRKELIEINKKNDLIAEKLQEKILLELQKNTSFVGVLTPSKVVKIIQPIIFNIFKKYNLMKFTSDETKKIKEKNLKLELEKVSFENKINTLYEQNKRLFREKTTLENELKSLKTEFDSVQLKLNTMIDEKNNENNINKNIDKIRKMKPK